MPRMTTEHLAARLRNAGAYQRLLEDVEQALDAGWLTDEQIRHLVAVLQKALNGDATA